ncbi:MAG: OmpH family outer membrane protein [Polyangiaceae bacterium]|nr:OmpH family outer membrane protein [Polyangiaceae bacterium]
MSPFRLPAWVAAVVVALVCTINAPRAHAETKVAVIDTQKAIMETEDGLRAQATLKKLFDSRQRELDRKQDELQKEKEDIERQRGVLSKAALQKRAEDWQREVVNLQSKFVEYNQELQQKQNELTQPIYVKAMTIIERIARRDGYDLVVDKQAVPYFRGDLDLTEHVIRLYNEGGGETSGKPAATAPTAAPRTVPAPAKPPPSAK